MVAGVFKTSFISVIFHSMVWLACRFTYFMDIAYEFYHNYFTDKIEDIIFEVLMLQLPRRV